MNESQRNDRFVIVADANGHGMETEFSERVEACMLECLPGVHTVRVLATPVFVEAPAKCPECDSRVTCEEVTADARNGARGALTCTNERCNWSGLAIYRLIDVETPDEGINRSAVLEGAIEPRFTSYE